MKLKYVIFGFFIAAAAFVCVMAFLLFYYRPTVEIVGLEGSRAGVLDSVGVTAPSVRDQGKNFSGKSGKVLIAYAGDVEGSLDPCG